MTSYLTPATTAAAGAYLSAVYGVGGPGGNLTYLNPATIGSAVVAYFAVPMAMDKLGITPLDPNMALLASAAAGIPIAFAVRYALYV